jgi:hypothetical protein
MYCGECDKNITTVDIVNQSLQRLRDAIIPGNLAQLNRPDTNINLKNFILSQCILLQERLQV